MKPKLKSIKGELLSKIEHPIVKNPLVSCSTEGTKRIAEKMTALLRQVELVILAKPGDRFDAASELQTLMMQVGIVSVDAAGELAAILRGEL